MRRLSSIFKRSDKSDDGSSRASDVSTSSAVAKKPPRFLRSLSHKSAAKPSVSTVPPVPQAYSSSSSSTDSPSPPTPDEETVPFHSVPRGPSLPWLSRKKSIPLSDSSPYGWNGPPSIQIVRPRHPPGTRTDDSEDDGSSATSSSRSRSTSPSTPRSVAPLAYAHSLTSNSLLPTLSVPPLLHLPGTPLFPRSSNLVSSLLYQETTRSTLHRTVLLRRLERRELSQSEKRSIVSFASRRLAPAKRVLTLRLDDDAVKDSKRISRTSFGLKNWVARPCFEDRMMVYTPAPPGSSQALNVSRVVGSALGVAALEISPGLEALAGLTVEIESEEFWTPSAVSGPSSLPLANAPATAQARTQQQKYSPSPLRLETTPLTHKASSDTTAATPRGPVNRRVKNSVRFEIDEEEDREDQIPLGQILRIKRGREEKAKFLKLQRERRLHEEERSKHEMERKQWEREKQAWEAERRAVEEERKKRQYAQEVVAARKRRESQIYKHGLSSELADPEVPTREISTTTYFRPHYDGRRQASEPSPYLSREDTSGNSSRTRVDSRQSLHSRPASPYSSHTQSSAEDVRREGRGSISKRGAQVPERPKSLMKQKRPLPSAWTAVPPLPYVPYYSFDMDNTPLLPPAPPFMMQRRRRSFTSSPSPDTSHRTEPPSKRQTVHLQHSGGEVQSSKRASMASSSPSFPAPVFSSKDRVSQSRSPPPSFPVQPSWLVSPNVRPSMPHLNRRQTTIT